VRWEPAGGLYDMRARTYDPATARFLTRDPVWLVLVDVESLNPYQYVYQSPLHYIDPRGAQTGLSHSNQVQLDQILGGVDAADAAGEGTYGDVLLAYQRIVDLPSMPAGEDVFGVVLFGNLFPRQRWLEEQRRQAIEKLRRLLAQQQEGTGQPPQWQEDQGASAEVTYLAQLIYEENRWPGGPGPTYADFPEMFERMYGRLPTSEEWEQASELAEFMMMGAWRAYRELPTRPYD
jgi:RHS repeat-associated protein